MFFETLEGNVNITLDPMEENSFDGCLCDPPYHLTQGSRGGSPRKPGTGPFGRHRLGERGFMGQTWDGGDIAFRKETWEKVLRVLKPGSFLIAFGGCRTYHRLACAIEDAGFDLRETLYWTYASGMPKSLNISKKLDQEEGAERKVVGKYQPPGMDKPWNLKNAKDERSVGIFASSRNNLDVTEPATDIARRFDGYGTNIKPSIEPVVLAMKPMDGTYTENARKWDVAGLNIGGSRTDSGDEEITINTWDDGAKPFGGGAGHSYTSRAQQGRWPMNFMLTCQCSERKHSPDCPVSILENQKEGASRFYYCAKASSKEKDAGLDNGNEHPTVKPLALIKHLANLIIPPVRASGERRLLVPFSGSGSEMVGSLLAGWDHVTGVELTPEYIAMARKRLEWWTYRMKEMGSFDIEAILNGRIPKKSEISTLFAD